MPTFETASRFERDWRKLTAEQQARFRKVITEAFTPTSSLTGLSAGGSA
ncbi:hypothetical protein AB0H88_02280 [Nonomuraea sp. NPDC050680]